MKNDIQTNAGVMGTDHVIPAQAGFYALNYCNKNGIYAEPVIAWLVTASGQVSALTTARVPEYMALERPDGSVVSDMLKTEFDSREEFARTMLAHSELLGRG